MWLFSQFLIPLMTKRNIALHASLFPTSFAFLSEIIDYTEMNDYILNLVKCRSSSSKRKQLPSEACFPFRFHISLAFALAQDFFCVCNKHPYSPQR